MNTKTDMIYMFYALIPNMSLVILLALFIIKKMKER